MPDRLCFSSGGRSGAAGFVQLARVEELSSVADAPAVARSGSCRGGAAFSLQAGGRAIVLQAESASEARVPPPLGTGSRVCTRMRMQWISGIRL